MYSVHVLDENIWVSLARLAFLPLLVGMWEGMEFARASLTIAKRDRLGRKFFAPDHGGSDPRGYRRSRSRGDRSRREGGLSCRRISSAGRSSHPLHHEETGWHCYIAAAEEGRSEIRAFLLCCLPMASIGLVLAVLAAPVYVPLGFDLWQGLSSPFRLISDAGGYINFLEI